MNINRNLLNTIIIVVVLIFILGGLAVFAIMMGNASRIKQDLTDGNISGRVDKKNNINIRGKVKNITVRNSNEVNILVEGQIEIDTQYDKASININKDTKIIDNLTNKAIKISDIKVNDKVEVEFTGMVAESYPVQAVAKSLNILK